jgi:hypothetical protein
MAEKLKLATPASYKVVKGLREGVKDLEVVAAQIQEMLGDKLEKLTNDYADEALKFEKLQSKIAEESKIAKVDLELAIKTNKKEAMENIANELGFVCVEQERYVETETEYELLKREFDNKIKEATNVIRKEYNDKIDAHVENLENRYKTDNAVVIAENTTLKERASFYEKQIENLEKQLDKANETVVAVAKASGSPTINVDQKK